MAALISIKLAQICDQYNIRTEIIEMRHWPTISMYGVLTRSAGKKYLEYLPTGGHVDIRIACKLGVSGFQPIKSLQTAPSGENDYYRLPFDLVTNLTLVAPSP